MERNPYSYLINHKILHKIGKKWAVVSIGLLMMLSGSIVCSQQAHASKVSEPITTSKVVINRGKVQRKAQKLHTHIMQNTIKPINHQERSNSITSYRKLHKHHKSNIKKHFRKYHNYGSTYLTPDYHHQEYFFTTQDLRYLQQNNSDLYNEHVSYNYDVKEPNWTRITKKARINKYHTDKIYVPGQGHDWVLNMELRHNKHYKHTNKTLNNLFNNLENSYLHKYYSKNSIYRIKALRKRFDYLNKYENKSYTSQAKYRKETIDWINFYRSYIYNEHNVKEDSKYDIIAQKGANDNRDPEDMDWGSETPRDAIHDYFTDANDADEDHQTGHRYSILRPSDVNVGVGHIDTRNSLFFNWGIDGNSPIEDVDYPRIGAFPISDAKEGEYWSYEMPYNPNSITINVYDETARKWLKVSNVYLYDNIAYYNVPTKKLKDHHIYEIITHEPKYGTQRYRTQLFHLSRNISSDEY